MKTVNNILGLLPEEQHGLKAIFDGFSSVNNVVLYGSRAKGTHRKGSDIDITLKGDDITTQQLLDMCSKVDDLLMPYKVDLSIFSDIDNKSLIEHINRVGKVIFER